VPHISYRCDQFHSRSHRDEGDPGGLFNGDPPALPMKIAGGEAFHDSPGDSMGDDWCPQQSDLVVRWSFVGCDPVERPKSLIEVLSELPGVKALDRDARGLQRDIAIAVNLNLTKVILPIELDDNQRMCRMSYEEVTAPLVMRVADQGADRRLRAHPMTNRAAGKPGHPVEKLALERRLDHRLTLRRQCDRIKLERFAPRQRFGDRVTSG
jgi:hypothetical protein